MRYIVLTRVKETIVGDLVRPAQQAIGAAMQRLLSSGKVVESGVFVDDRGGFAVVNVESAEELFELLTGLHDLMTIETHPLISYERVGQYFEQQQQQRATRSG
jgi:hypothetical protein